MSTGHQAQDLNIISSVHTMSTGHQAQDLTIISSVYTISDLEPDDQCSLWELSL
jgi:hypothetical protein